MLGFEGEEMDSEADTAVSTIALQPCTDNIVARVTFPFSLERSHMGTGNTIVGPWNVFVPIMDKIAPSKVRQVVRCEQSSFVQGEAYQRWWSAQNQELDPCVQETWVWVLFVEFLYGEMESHEKGNETGKMERNQKVSKHDSFVKQSTRRAILLSLCETIYVHVMEKVMKNQDPHQVCWSMQEEDRQVFLCSWYTVQYLHLGDPCIQKRKCAERTMPAFVRHVYEGRMTLFALFGGQGITEDYLSELSQLYKQYRPILVDYLMRVCTGIMEQAEKEKQRCQCAPWLSQGLDVLKWIQQPEGCPNKEYLSQAPISLPIIGIIQLCHYYLLFKTLQMTPKELMNHFQGATGHSQGILAAVIVSASHTEEEFIGNSVRGVLLLYFIGLRAQQTFGQRKVSHTPIGQKSPMIEDHLPTPMMAITGLSQELAESSMRHVNTYLPASRPVRLGLINGPKFLVFSGAPESLQAFSTYLEKSKTPSTENISRTPFSERKPPFSIRFLPISVPFHSDYLCEARQWLEKDVCEHDLKFVGTRFLCPVYATDGTNRNLSMSKNISLDLVDHILSMPVHWQLATHHRVTHMVDFGPGESSGIASLTYRNLEGTGVQMVLASSFTSVHSGISSKIFFYETADSHLSYGVNWSEAYAPKLIRLMDGRVLVDTLFTRVMGKPPLMVAGMTPSSVNEQFVAACINAGYHCELAGGGHYTESALRDRMNKLRERIPLGEGVTLNVLFLNVKQWGFQYPLVQSMRREGYPLEGFCIAAGIPSEENAKEIVQSIRAAGIRHVGFKPSTVEAILQVVKVAEQNPTFPILLQWTGGRAGGHHSFEDFYQPILETYAAIRRQSNILLIAGSGIGDAEDSFPYLTGEWSQQLGHSASMPFDAVLLASRMLVAKECLTSEAAKDLIVNAPGIEDERHWDQSYHKSVGGVTTVISELGEPIHKISTRGVMLWKELDKTIFNLPREKRLSALLEKKDYIIERLNRDYQRVWFGKKQDGRVVGDVQDMTYAEVAYRLLDLMYIPHQHRWIDQSYCQFMVDFLVRTEERLGNDNQLPASPSHTLTPCAINARWWSEPRKILDELFAGVLSCGQSQLLTTEDSIFFIKLCQRPGQKPVPFIPCIDEDFGLWFKKDSLWQAEDLDAVVDGDAERVCILQGPVSVKYSYIKNEPIKQILDNIHQRYVEFLFEQLYPQMQLNQATNLLPTIEHFEKTFNQSTKVMDLSAFVAMHSPSHPVKNSGGYLEKREYTCTKTALMEQWDSDTWISLLVETFPSWLRALLTTSFIVQNKWWGTNFVRTLVERPFSGLTTQIEWQVEDTLRQPVSLLIYDAHSLQNRVHISIENSTHVSEGMLICVRLYEGVHPLEFLFRYHPSQSYALIHEVMDDRLLRIKRFYWNVWFGSEDGPFDEFYNESKVYTPWNVHKGLSRFFSKEEVVVEEKVHAFLHAVGYEMNCARLLSQGFNDSASKSPLSENGKMGFEIPLDFSIVLGWKPVIRALFPVCGMNGDLLHLVHLSTAYRRLVHSPINNPTTWLKVGDVVRTHALVDRIQIVEGGKVITIRATLERVDSCSQSSVVTPLIEITNQFMYRGSSISFEEDFTKGFCFHRYVEKHAFLLHMNTAKDISVLHSKPWIRLKDSKMDAGTCLLFDGLECFEQFVNTKERSFIRVVGRIYRIENKNTLYPREHIGEIDYCTVHLKGSCICKEPIDQIQRSVVITENPVLEYLTRLGKPVVSRMELEQDGYSILPEKSIVFFTSPDANQKYASASGDINPIHLNPFIAQIAQLPGTITHGLWTSAATRRMFEEAVFEGQPYRLVYYEASFTDMVLPRDLLTLHARHVAVQNGRLICKLQITSERTGTTVLEGVAELLPQSCAYVFTGQGSQEPGMGMDLYASSSIAKEIWDRADSHLLNVFGFSILEIVRNNPKEKTIYFGGLRGQQIRDHYRDMFYEMSVDGLPTHVPLFPEIDHDSMSYTFRSPTGLLNATQFTQPALTIMENAAFEDMRRKGLVPEDLPIPFAGHSLGEYSALASRANVLPIERLVEIVFYRGMTIQVAVKRDAEGNSDYGMVAVNPSRVSPQFPESILAFIVTKIQEKYGLLQIVNYNVVNWQYVVSGSLTTLDVLSHVLNQIKALNLDWNDLSALASKEKGNLVSATMVQLCQHLTAIIDKAHEFVHEKRHRQNGLFKLERGIATIPLQGVDVPFHSHFLLPGVNAFREYLLKKLSSNDLQLELLENQYIPNLTARPFRVDRDYFLRVYNLTQSERLHTFLCTWEADDACTKDPEAFRALAQQRGFTLFVELLAYQFASPVQWTDTQRVLFDEKDRGELPGFNVQGIIEIGPSPVLANMATQTLKMLYAAQDETLGRKRTIYCYTRDKKDIYFTKHNEDMEMTMKSTLPVSILPPSTEVSVHERTPTLVASASGTGTQQSLPPSALFVLHSLVSQKLKRPLQEVSVTNTIRELVNGKSTLQNEILGDIQKEFSTGRNTLTLTEKLEELPLGELATHVHGSSGSPGPVTTTLINRMVSSKIPAGIHLGQIRSYFLREFNASIETVHGILLYSVVDMSSTSNFTRFPNESAVWNWFETMATGYATYMGSQLLKITGTLASSISPQIPSASKRPSSADLTSFQIPDAPVSPAEFIRTMLGMKLKRAFKDIPETRSIQELVGGKSALQNEILGDLQQEIGQQPMNALENASTIPIGDLNKLLRSAYLRLGKISRQLLNRMFNRILPPGTNMSTVRQYLKEMKGILSEQSIDGVLLHALTMEPPSRLSDVAEMHNWICSVLDDYCQSRGFSKVVTMNKAASTADTMDTLPFMNSGIVHAFTSKYDRLAEEQMNLLAKFLQKDLRDGQRNCEHEMQSKEELTLQLELWMKEHGDRYGEGIRPVFQPPKVRVYDSSWNWIRQDIFQYFQKMHIHQIVSVPTEDILQRWSNCASTPLLRMLEFESHRRRVHMIDSNTCDPILSFLERIRGTLHKPPRLTCSFFPPSMRPLATFNERGELLYHEESRSNVHTFAEYIDELRTKSYAFIRSLHGSYQKDLSRTSAYFSALSDLLENGLSLNNKNVLITGCGPKSIGAELLKLLLIAGSRIVATTSNYSFKTMQFYQSLYQKYGSRGSALVVLPFNQSSIQDIHALGNYLYSSELVPLFHSGNHSDTMFDIDVLIPFAAIPENGRELSELDDRSELAHRLMLTNLFRLLGVVIEKKRQWKLNTRPAHVILPLSPNHGLFGGDGLYSESKIGLETLFNRWFTEQWQDYLSIMGAVIGWTRGTGLMNSNDFVSQGIEERTGIRTFSICEMAWCLTSLLHPRMLSLSEHEPLCAVFSGGMGMNVSENSDSSQLKKVITEIRDQLKTEGEIRSALFEEKQREAKSFVLCAQENVSVRLPINQPLNLSPRANLTYPYPKLSSLADLHSRLGYMKGMLDLEQTIVITGFGELGPYGHSRTRWEMEAMGEFSLEGCVELAWIMGLIRFSNGQDKQHSHLHGYVGWVDVSSGKPIHDMDVKRCYEHYILEHSGIRFIEPNLFEGYDPHRKTFIRPLVLTEDMGPIEISKEEAMQFKLQHGDQADVWPKGGSVDEWYAVLKRGTTLYVPKALPFETLVAGQIPTGWDPSHYGIPRDIIEQVDPVTLYVLVSTVEALVSSGITDPYEFYQYVHVSQVGNTLGSGVGGQRANIRIYKDRFLEKSVQSDILQESFINTMAAWVNLLLISSSGPIKTPVGACASAIQSIDIGMETILQGKAKIVLAGGFDDFREEGSFEFANMKATSNAIKELECGREPKEMSRPTASSRSGFMEAHGAGVQILMRADIALEMGVPIYGVLALSNTAMDREGRSIPAPGQGILTTAREVHKHLEEDACCPPNKPRSISTPLCLDIQYRSRSLQMEKVRIREWMAQELEHFQRTQYSTSINDHERTKLILQHAEMIQYEAARQLRAVYSLWTNHFYRDNERISPLRGALAVFGLTIDDIDVASFHGTGTKANDINESEVVHEQLEHLGRSPGHPLLGIFQKHLTGHPKGAAAAWMLNGVLQVITTGIVPGNRNVDNVDVQLMKYDHLCYPNQSTHVGHVKAALLKSFGFGQVGGEILVVHPDYLFAAVEDHLTFQRYCEKRWTREMNTYRFHHDWITGKHAYVQLKSSPPYTESQQQRVFLDPTARASYNEKAKTWLFREMTASIGTKAESTFISPLNIPRPASPTTSFAQTLLDLSRTLHHTESSTSIIRGIGVDIEVVHEFHIENDNFLERNFTPSEIAYCQSRPDARASFAGRWSAKEAIIKAVGDFARSTQGLVLYQSRQSLFKGAGNPLKDIEILPASSENTAPHVRLHGEMQDLSNQLGAKEFHVSISHSGDYSVAIAHVL